MHLDFTLKPSILIIKKFPSSEFPLSIFLTQSGSVTICMAHCKMKMWSFLFKIQLKSAGKGIKDFSFKNILLLVKYIVTHK